MLNKYLSCLGFVKNQSSPCAADSPSLSTGEEEMDTGELFTPLPTDHEITAIEYKNFILQRVFEEVIHPTMHDIFTKLIWQTKYDEETLKTYIFRQCPPPSNNQYKKTFGKLEREKIDSNPECDRFNISLYFRSLSLTARYCSQLSSNPILRDEFKDKLKEIKEIRNHLVHNLLIVPEEQIDKYVKDLKLIMNNILDLIGDLFEIRADTDNQQVIVHEGIDEIMKQEQPTTNNSTVYFLFTLVVVSAIINLKLFITKYVINKYHNLLNIY